MTRSSLALAAPAVAFVAIFLVWPLAAIAERSFTGGVPWGVVVESSTLDVLWFTFWQAAVSTLLTLLAGLPLTWALARHDFRGRALVEALILVPFVLPTLVVATAFVTLLPGGVERSLLAILLAHVFFNVAVVVRIVAPSWAALDPRLGEAARLLGASPRQILRTVTAPLLRPALTAAGAIVFLFCFTSFGVVLVLGAPRYATLEVEIYTQAVRFFDLRTAATLALIQLAAVGVTVALAGVLEQRLPARSRPSAAALRPDGPRRAVVFGIVAVGLSLLVLPLAAVFRTALSAGSFASLFDETPALLVPPWHAVVNSVAYASVATLLAVALGAPAALAIARGGRLVNVLLMLPLGASAAMLGFGFLLAFDTGPLDLRGTRAIVPLAQALVALPFVIRALVPPLRAFDRRLNEVAATLGAGPARRARTITAPLLGRALAAAAGIAFAISLGEFGATVFLARADAPTLPVAIYRFLGRPGAENVATAATLTVCLAALVVIASMGTERSLARRR